MGKNTEKESDRKPGLGYYFSAFLVFIFALFGIAALVKSFLPSVTDPTVTNTIVPTDSITVTPSGTPSLTETLSFTVTSIPTSTPTNTVTETPTLQAQSTLVSSLELINVKIQSSSLICNTDGEVNYVVVKLLPYGGTAPYEYEIIITAEVSETHAPVAENEPIVLVIKGGQTKHLRIKSSISTKWEWTGKISIPAKDEQCVRAKHTRIASLSSTPVPTSTKSSETPTATSSIPTLTPSATSNIPTLTSSPTSFLPTKTFTFTPVPPTKTFTPTPIPPTKTFTFTPIPPTKTNTPSPIPPSAKQCEDGIDNDDDELIDYPNDPGCTDPKDNKESR